jgi:hypothetical protein
MILLDTNILSELMRPSPAVVVEEWLGAQPSTSLFISAVTEAELRFGLALLPDGKRRSQLLAEVDNIWRRISPTASCPSTAPPLSPTPGSPPGAAEPAVRSRRLTLRSRRSPNRVAPRWPLGT